MGLRMWAIVIVVGVLAMAEHSTQLNLRNPVYEIAEKTKRLVGVIALTTGAECALNASKVFKVETTFNHAGKIFRIGRINRTRVVYARSGELMVNVGSTVQVMVDIFNVRGIVHFGGAGSTNNNTNRIGDVSVPSQVAYTGAWSWRNSSKDKVEPFLRHFIHGNLSFGDFNVPPKGDNLLGRIFYWASTWFTDHQKPNNGFWLPVNHKWLRIADNLHGIVLDKHVNATVFVPYQPKIKFRLKAGTSDMFIVNEAYGKFLLNTFNISTVDTSDSAIAMTCFSNNIPYIVFRGVSNIIKDNNPKPDVGPLGNKNAVKVTAAFLGLLFAENNAINAMAEE